MIDQLYALIERNRWKKMIKIYIQFPSIDITSKYEERRKKQRTPANSFHIRSQLTSISIDAFRGTKNSIQQFTVIGSETFEEKKPRRRRRRRSNRYLNEGFSTSVNIDFSRSIYISMCTLIRYQNERQEQERERENDLSIHNHLFEI